MNSLYGVVISLVGLVSTVFCIIIAQKIKNREKKPITRVRALCWAVQAWIVLNICLYVLVKILLVVILGLMVGVATEG